MVDKAKDNIRFWITVGGFLIALLASYADNKVDNALIKEQVKRHEEQLDNYNLAIFDLKLNQILCSIDALSKKIEDMEKNENTSSNNGH